MGPSAAGCGLLRLPPELLLALVGDLDTKSLGRLALVSRSFFAALGGVLATSLREIRLVLEDDACRISLDLESASRLLLSLCQCPQHVPRHAAFLCRLLPAFPHLQGLLLEDSLLCPDHRLHPTTLAILLHSCPRLQTLELHDVDLSGLPAASLAHLADFRSIRNLALVHCLPRINDRLSDGLLARVLGSGLEQLLLKGCDAVSDESLRHLAQHCRQLWLGDFEGCGAVSARGVAEFAVALPWRLPDLLSLRLQGTAVDAITLQNYLDAQAAPRRWFCKPVHAPPGCPAAITVSNPSLANKAILLQI